MYERAGQLDVRHKCAPASQYKFLRDPCTTLYTPSYYPWFEQYVVAEAAIETCHNPQSTLCTLRTTYTYAVEGHMQKLKVAIQAL